MNNLTSRLANRVAQISHVANFQPTFTQAANPKQLSQQAHTDTGRLARPTVPQQLVPQAHNTHRHAGTGTRANTVSRFLLPRPPNTLDQGRVPVPAVQGCLLHALCCCKVGAIRLQQHVLESQVAYACNSMSHVLCHTVLVIESHTTSGPNLWSTESVPHGSRKCDPNEPHRRYKQGQTGNVPQLLQQSWSDMHTEQHSIMTRPKEAAHKHQQQD
jgi:hypothetical protein